MDNPTRYQLRELARRHYDLSPRAYHNWAHIEACWSEWQGVRSHCENPVAVELAIWFHDCIYDPARHDNEHRSADVATEAILKIGGPDSLAEIVYALILDTRHAKPPSSPDGLLLVDIDLSILGQPREVYDRYERAIRSEYAHVPDNAFSAGRTAVLRSFLDRARIYQMPWFIDRYEAAARENLRLAIAALATPGFG